MLFIQVQKDGSFKLIDIMTRGGRCFVGMGSLMTGAKVRKEHILFVWCFDLKKLLDPLSMFEFILANYFTERGCMAYVTHVLCMRSIRAFKQSRSHKILTWLGKYWISCGKNVLLDGNSRRLRFDAHKLKFWLKNKLVRYAHSCVLYPNLNSRASNLNLHS